MNNLLDLEGLFSQSVVESLGWVLVHSLWQFALVALLAGASGRAMRRSSSTMRYGVLVVAMAVSVAAPAATWIQTAGDQPAPVARRVELAPTQNSINANDAGDAASRISSGATLPGDLETVVPASELAASSVAAESPPSVSPHTSATIQPEPTWLERAKSALQPWLVWIVVGWVVGVVVCSARPLLGWYTLRRFRRVGVSPVSNEVLSALRRVSKQLGLRGAVQLLQSTLAQVPIVVGYFRPVVLLPVSLATSIPVAQLELILAHELAHVRRHDFAVNLLQTLIETLFFYHPAVWWLSRQIRIEREHCCDDLVVKLFGNRIEYGRALIAIEQLRGQNSLLALGATDGSLLSRVRRIVGFDSDRRASSLAERWPAALLGIVLIGISGVLSMSWNLAANDEPKTKTVETAPPKGIEILTPDPKLHELSSWSSFRHDLAQTGVTQTLLPDKLDLLWEAKLGDSVLGTAAIVGDHVYVPCLSGELVCLDRRTGRKLWAYRSTSDVTPKSSAPGFKSSPTVEGDSIYLGDEEGAFHSIDRATGKSRWTFKTENEILSSAAVVEGKVLFGSYDNHLYCLNAKDGALIWKIATEHYVHAAPTVIEGQVLIAGCDGHLRIIDLATGTQKGDVPLETPLIGSPAVLGDLVYLGSYGNEVLAVNWKNKDVVWRYATGRERPFHSSAAVTDKLVVLGGRDKLVHAIDRTTGKAAWTFATRSIVDSSPVVVGQRIFIGSNDGNLYELDVATGTERWRFELGSPITASPAIAEGVIVFGGESNEGKVVCLGEPPSAPTPAVKGRGGRSVSSNRTVRVRVVDAKDSTPIEGIVVEAERWEGARQYEVDAVGTTDANGFVEFKGLDAIRYCWEMSASKAVPYIADFWGSGPEESDVVIKLPKACELTLRAVDAETGLGIPGVRFGRERAAGEYWLQDIVPDTLTLTKDFVPPVRRTNTPAGMAKAAAALRARSKDVRSVVTDGEGRYSCLVEPITWSYSVAKFPKGYDSIVPINGRQEVEIETPSGGRVEYTFKLRKAAGVAANFPPPKPDELRGLDLSKVAVRGYQEAYRSTPDLYVQDPVDPESWNYPKNVFQMPLAEHTWLKYPAGSGHFYIEHRHDGIPQNEQLYGPIEGDPFEVLKLDELFREQLKPGATAGDPRYRLRLMFATGEPGLIRRAAQWIERELARKFSREEEGLHRRLEILESVRAALRNEADAFRKPELQDLVTQLRKRVAAAEMEIDQLNDSVPNDNYQSVTYMQPKLAAKIPDVLWGRPLDGLRLGLVPREGTSGIDWNELPLNTPLPPSITVQPGHEHRYQLVVENVSDSEIKFCGVFSGEDEERTVDIRDQKGKPVAIQRLHTTIPHFRDYWRLKPGERMLISMPTVHFRTTDGVNQGLGYTVNVAPGEYTLRCSFRFGHLDNVRNRHVPGTSEWIGELSTGAQKITMRE